MISLEAAKMQDLGACLGVVDDGRAFQREQGFVQWKDGYPGADILTKDITLERAYVLLCDKDIAGYMCIDFLGEPAYENIIGEWNTDGAYAVVHRMAFARRYIGRGLSHTAFDLIEDLCKKNGIYNIRIDTDFPNKRMQHILKKHGFKECGTVFYGKESRLAFDKRLFEN